MYRQRVSFKPGPYRRKHLVSSVCALSIEQTFSEVMARKSVFTNLCNPDDDCAVPRGRRWKWKVLVFLVLATCKPKLISMFRSSTAVPAYFRSSLFWDVTQLRLVRIFLLYCCWWYNNNNNNNSNNNWQFQWPPRLLGFRFRIPPGAWVFVVSCVVAGRGPCDGPVTWSGCRTECECAIVCSRTTVTLYPYNG